MEDWTPITRDEDLPLDKAVRVEVGDLHVFLYRTSERIFALDNRCSHQGGPLHRGRVKADGPQPSVMCPIHGSTFWLTTGRVIRGPASRAQTVYEARINDGMIEIRLPGGDGFGESGG